MQSVGDFPRGGDDCVCLVGSQLAEVLIHLCARRFQQSERPDLSPFQAPEGDREILHRTLSLGLPQGFGRNPDLTHRVVLDPVFAVCGGLDGHVSFFVVATEGRCYGSGCVAEVSPVKSTAAYSLSLDSRW